MGDVVRSKGKSQVQVDGVGNGGGLRCWLGGRICEMSRVITVSAGKRVACGVLWFRLLPVIGS